MDTSLSKKSFKDVGIKLNLSNKNKIIDPN